MANHFNKRINTYFPVLANRNRIRCNQWSPLDGSVPTTGVSKNTNPPT